MNTNLNTFTYDKMIACQLQQGWIQPKVGSIQVQEHKALWMYNNQRLDTDNSYGVIRSLSYGGFRDELVNSTLHLRTW